MIGKRGSVRLNRRGRGWRKVDTRYESLIRQVTAIDLQVPSTVASGTEDTL